MSLRRAGGREPSRDELGHRMGRTLCLPIRSPGVAGRPNLPFAGWHNYRLKVLTAGHTAAFRCCLELSLRVDRLGIPLEPARRAANRILVCGSRRRRDSIRSLQREGQPACRCRRWRDRRIRTFVLRRGIARKAGVPRILDRLSAGRCLSPLPYSPRVSSHDPTRVEVSINLGFLGGLANSVTWHRLGTTGPRPARSSPPDASGCTNRGIHAPSCGDLRDVCRQNARRFPHAYAATGNNTRVCGTAGPFAGAGVHAGGHFPLLGEP